MIKPPTDPIIEQKPIIPIPDTVTARALKRVQALCKGNGVKGDDIKFVESKGQVYEFPARTLVRLTTLVDTKTISGKSTAGEIISSPVAFQSALQSLLESTKTDANTRKSIIDLVINRADKGFSARDQKIPIPSLTRDYVSHEVCGSCTGKGKNTCHACSGKGQTLCNTCQGRNNILCPNCRGSGHITQGGKRVPCAKCQTRGRIPCPSCGARGIVTCSKCRGAKDIQCARCSGTGNLSHIAHVTVDGHLHFDFERQGLPLQVGKRIDVFGARHAAQKDFLITPVNTHINAPHPANEPPDMVAIDYDVKIPHGPLTFMIKSKPIKCTVLGYRGEILESPPFLQDLTRAAQNALNSASNTPSQCTEGLRFAAKFRLFRDIILLAAKQTDQRNAIQMLHKKYPFGVTADGLLGWYVAAQNALRHLTRRPRWVGTGIGLTIAVLMWGIYVFAGFQTQLVTTQNLNPTAMMITDIIGWLAGYGVTILAASLSASQQIKSTLAGVVATESWSKLFPPPKRTNLYAGLFASFAFLLIYGLGIMVGKLPAYAIWLSLNATP